MLPPRRPRRALATPWTTVRWRCLPGKLFHQSVNHITISLNSHAHRGWMSNGRELLATVMMNTEQAPMVRHHFSASPLQ